jgi:hypothetical protein
MKVIDPGHCYDLAAIDGGDIQRLRFVKRVGPQYPGNDRAYGGTTTQEVIRALMNRCQYVKRQIPCWQTTTAIWLFRGIILLFEHRAKRRKGKWLPLRALRGIEFAATCPHCGHVYCAENHEGGAQPEPEDAP